ncbi:DUF120 domain-containing protein [Methanoplanus sp. FWC-SCC4]|uniref:Riboflavin kinase n=1 Tax=Methanochimaera problematica TaxID=2609417 RepID=A0AA97FDU4_9EURY|nr:DUF120 domain-containing protein [Methanoplanus sp. FWC-SCC4]WOF16712.1 DUF120 domain-containing protein [Methanoplanus sp. FWC-SCC4]
MATAEDLISLKKIGQMGGLNGQVNVSSQKLGDALGISPQTASRRLISLEKEELITRSVRQDGQYVSITKSGEDSLKKEYADYKRLFEESAGTFRIEGEVVSGLGEGRYYVAIPGYVAQFKERLGIDPFPGTLNVKLDPANVETRKKAEMHGWVDIDGFKADERTFGAAKCLPCRISGIKCAIIVPGRTHHLDDVIEIISGVRLREELGLKDGIRITVEVCSK